jgi:transcription antitermination protein NusB
VSSGRRSARRQAVFILYQQDLLERDWQSGPERTDTVEIDAYSRSLVLGVAEEHAAIDAVLQAHVAGWSLERLGTLERAILRLATYELLWESGVPEAVAIDEAVGLAKRFCSDEAAALVNGVLGSVAASEKDRISGIRSSGEPDTRRTT